MILIIVFYLYFIAGKSQKNSILTPSIFIFDNIATDRRKKSNKQSIFEIYN